MSPWTLKSIGEAPMQERLATGAYTTESDFRQIGCYFIETQ
jgi:hypothetical protein